MSAWDKYHESLPEAASQNSYLVAVANDGSGLYLEESPGLVGSAKEWMIRLPDGMLDEGTDYFPKVHPMPPPNGGRWSWPPKPERPTCPVCNGERNVDSQAAWLKPDEPVKVFAETGTPVHYTCIRCNGSGKAPMAPTL